MITFVLKKIVEIEGKVSFYKLIMNETCEFDLFWEEIEKDGNLKGELLKIQTLMSEISDNKSLPQQKFRNITPKKENVTEYEIKTKHLRVYLFQEKHTGKIIVSGGKKTTQKKDIKHFRKLKKQYFQSKNF